MSNKKTDWFVCRDRLAGLKLGTVLEDTDGHKAIVIEQDSDISDEVAVEGKCVMNVEDEKGHFCSFLWNEYYDLNQKCRVVGRWRAGETK